MKVGMLIQVVEMYERITSWQKHKDMPKINLISMIQKIGTFACVTVYMLGVIKL